MWERPVKILMRAFQEKRKTFKAVENKLVNIYGRTTINELKKEALERLGYTHTYRRKS